MILARTLFKSDLGFSILKIGWGYLVLLILMDFFEIADSFSWEA